MCEISHILNHADQSNC